MEINESIEDIFAFIERKNELGIENEEKVKVLNERFQLVLWQVEGIKKKYLHELTKKYE